MKNYILLFACLFLLGGSLFSIDFSKQQSSDYQNLSVVLNTLSQISQLCKQHTLVFTNVQFGGGMSGFWDAIERDQKRRQRQEFMSFMTPILIIGGILAVVGLIARTKSWTYRYGAHHIEVKCTPAIIEMRVNGMLQDKKGTITYGELHGKLDSGEVIRASVGGYFVANCSLFIENKIIHPN
jgi:hypothetical protein